MKGLEKAIVFFSVVIIIFAILLGLRKLFRKKTPPIYGRDPRVIDIALVAASIFTLFAARPPTNELEWLLYGALFIGIVLTPLLMQLELAPPQEPLELQNRSRFLVYRNMVSELQRRRDFLSLAILLLPIFCLIVLMVAQASSSSSQ